MCYIKKKKNNNNDIREKEESCVDARNVISKNKNHDINKKMSDKH